MESSPPSMNTGLSRATVLVVDDEPPVLRALSRDLRLLGFDPVSASDPSIALAMLEVRRFDAVLSDLQLPMPNGDVFASSAARTAPSTTSLSGNPPWSQPTAIFINPHNLKPIYADQKLDPFDE